MKLLLREYIVEQIKSLDEIAVGSAKALAESIILWINEDGGAIRFNLVNIDSTLDEFRRNLDTDERSFQPALQDAIVRGMIGTLKATRNNKCGGYEINHVIANSGYGPLLYDVAIQFLTNERSSSLMADRYSVSDEAEKVWKYYFQKRGEVKRESLVDTKCNDEHPYRPWLHYKYSMDSREYETMMQPDRLIDGIVDVAKEELDYDLDIPRLEVALDKFMNRLGTRKFAHGYKF